MPGTEIFCSLRIESFLYSTVRLFDLFRDSQTFHHGSGGVQLRRIIQMRVDVRRGGEVTVTEPFLDLLQLYTVLQKQTGARVPLRYNYDKPEKPCNSNGFAVCQLDSSSFSNLRNQVKILCTVGGVKYTTQLNSVRCPAHLRTQGVSSFG